VGAARAVTAADAELVEEPLHGPGARSLFPGLIAELQELYPEWTPEVPPRLTARDVAPPSGRWLVAYRDGVPIGCAALKRLDHRTAEIKRLYVAPDERGTGVARALIGRLEQIARQVGYSAVRMDTGPRQPASVALFSSIGYESIADYNGNPVAAFWAEKPLV
jgi:GNAT superfamily N-acetyltransferase